MLGIVVGIVSALAIGRLTFFVPALFPGLGLEFFWIGWSIAPIAGILGGAVIGKLVHHIAIRRVEVAERGVKRSDLRDL